MQKNLQYENWQIKVNENYVDLKLKCEEAKNRVIKQFPNIYKNTKMLQSLIQNNPISTMTEYNKIHGLILNIQKRFMWYANLETLEDFRILLLPKTGKFAYQDLTETEEDKYFFTYYLRITTKIEKKTVKTIIPLIDLNVRII